MQKIKLQFTCLKCGAVETVEVGSLEDLIYSDPHDPDTDYLKCSSCNAIRSLKSKVEGELINTQGESYDIHLYSDDCDLFVQRVADGFGLKVTSLVQIQKQLDMIK